MASETDILAEAQEAFEAAVEAEADNRKEAKDDLEFARLEKQWPENVKKEREEAGRPMLTINRLPTFIRQVVNDARQNKPSIKVLPVDDAADPETAKIMDGLIRNIEYASGADVAYDTAAENAVSMGWGYVAVDLDYAHDDTVDLDIKIRRVANPFSIYGDPDSEEADSSDWMRAFEVEWFKHKAFEAEFGKEVDKVDWKNYLDGVSEPTLWGDEKQVLVAKYWKREKTLKKVYRYLTQDGAASILDDAALDMDMGEGLTLRAMVGMGMGEIAGEAEVPSYSVTRYLMTGAEILKEEKWPGCFIPIVPFYGDEVNVEGKRHFRSLIRGAKDAQRMLNYWRTTATELVALAPRAPWVGEQGAFSADPNWKRANSMNVPYLEFKKGHQMPQRQPLDTGAAAGALQEAMNASDDMKSIMGLYDASLGARSNETSGKAIMARQREGDTATYHFIDNTTRGIRHLGRILIDLIPKVYGNERIIRVLGEDGASPQNIPLGQPVPVQGAEGQPEMEPVVDEMTGQPVVDPQTQQPAMAPKTRVYDLTKGKYDLVVKAGPSFTSRREEAGHQMAQMMQAMPDGGMSILDIVAESQDWPGSDKIAERLKTLQQQSQGGGIPPEVEQEIQKLQEALQAAQAEAAELKAQAPMMQLEAKQAEIDLNLQAKQQETHDRLAAKRAEKDIDLEYKVKEKQIDMATRPVALDDAGGAVEVVDPLVPVLSEVSQAVAGMAQAQAMTAQALSDIAAAQRAPKRLVRDPVTGRASHVETVN